MPVPAFPRRVGGSREEVVVLPLVGTDVGDPGGVRFHFQADAAHRVDETGVEGEILAEGSDDLVVRFHSGQVDIRRTGRFSGLGDGDFPDLPGSAVLDRECIAPGLALCILRHGKEDVVVFSDADRKPGGKKISLGDTEGRPFHGPGDGTGNRVGGCLVGHLEFGLRNLEDGVLI